jgi:ribonuclease E
LLRGLEEILMKGATHNLVVRTRTDVALYVLNHKRGHLRDLESSFKVTLSVIADPTVSGQQSFIIDRGEQVHTLEAAKALLAAQVAASPSQVEEPYDEDEELDVESEAEVETEESEGLAEDAVAGEAGGGSPDGDAQKRKRRRRRRGRSGEPREGGPRNEDHREEHDAPHIAAEAGAGAATDDAEGDEDEGEEQPGSARGDQSANGERRPRRGGRRGGRRRRGGPEDGLAGSIADELGPTPAPEAASAVADFDGGPSEQPLSVIQPESIASPPVSHRSDHGPQEALRAPSAEETAQETAQEAEKAAARRRSTVREKVSFLSDAQPSAVTTAEQRSSEPPAATPAPAQPEPTDDNQPRKAGWWSRRFGGGE